MIGITLTIFLAFTVLAEAQKETHIRPGRSTIVHLFEWKWKDIAKECESFLSPKGYGAVQTSPPNENKVISNRPWYERYQPLSYKLVTRSGNEQEFANMVKRCNAVGVRIYADIVMNHMANGGPDTTGTAGSKATPSEKLYPAVPYSPDDFHETCTIESYQNLTQVRNCELVGLRDIDQSKSHVRQILLKYMNKLIDYGVAGFRIDGAKHMNPDDLKVIYKSLKNLNTAHGFTAGARPYIMQEVIDLGSEPVKTSQFTPYGVVTEFRYSDSLSYVLRKTYTMKELANWGPKRGFIPNSKDALVFMNNHDNERGHGAGGKNIITYKDRKLYIMGNAFMLAHPYGTPRILSNFDFTDRDAGPPHDSSYNTLSPNPSGHNCSNGWLCEQRWRELCNMVAFRNHVGNSQLHNFWYNPRNENQISFCRGNKGFIAFTNEGDLRSLLDACVPAGIYCDVISGEMVNGRCTGKTVVVGLLGKAYIRILAGDKNGVLAIHTGAKIS